MSPAPNQKGALTLLHCPLLVYLVGLGYERVVAPDLTTVKLEVCWEGVVVSGMEACCCTAG